MKYIQRKDGQKLILDALERAYENAKARADGLGMTNVAGLSGVEKVKLDMAYQQAITDQDNARRALEEYLKQIGQA